MDRPRILLPLAVEASAALADQERMAAGASASVQADIRDIRGPMPSHDAPLSNLPPFALTGGAFLLAGGLFVLLRRRSVRQAPALPPPAVEGPGEQERLARLVLEYEQGLCPEDLAIVRLDALVRAALVTAMGIPAPRLTSQEVRLQACQAPALGEVQRGRLDHLLELADWVKFAEYQPGPAEVGEALDAAGDLLAGPLAGGRP